MLDAKANLFCLVNCCGGPVSSLYDPGELMSERKTENSMMGQVVGIRRLRRRNFVILESLSTRVFETRTATGREHFAC